MNFTQLHIHTLIGSKLDGISSPMEYAKIAKEMGHKYLACTDHGSLSALFELQKACDEFDLKPIFGLEQYVVKKEEIERKLSGVKGRYNSGHLILLAYNEQGYENLCRLHYMSHHDEGHFYYKNHNTFEEIFKFSEGLIAGTACISSPFAKYLRNGEPEKGEELFKQFKEVFKDNFFAELQLNELTDDTIEGLEEGQKTVNNYISYLADKYDVKKVITGDVHYAEPEDEIIQRLSISFSTASTKGKADNFEINTKSLYYHSVDDYKDFNKKWEYGYTNEQIEEWCNNTNYFAEKCTYTIPERDHMIIPTLTSDDITLMGEEIYKGLEAKMAEGIIDKNQKEEYIERIEYEKEILTRKGFASYVMLLWDIFKFCSDNNFVVGLGRGSGAGSLVMYLLGITKIDPIKNGLIFERFLSDSRSPDVVVSYFKELK